MTRVFFTVDAHLLAELGERLVGKPSIALAELIKNSYDADATSVQVIVSADRILVHDNGHGMTEAELHNGFLRVGTAQKGLRRVSPHLRRQMTGSKGVGRLASQMLGRGMTVETRSQGGPLLRLTINWDEKDDGDDLTRFGADLAKPSRAEFLTSPTGTAISITGLPKRWQEEDIKSLAREVWMLRSPFRAEADGFAIEFSSEDESLTAAFGTTANAWLDLHEARVVGDIHEPHEQSAGHPGGANNIAHAHLRLEFPKDRRKHRLIVPLDARAVGLSSLDPRALGRASFEIRVYKLQGRQPKGISVTDVRAYLNEFGGVHLFDDDFRLPYYGPTTDWLGIEMDHAHRVTLSQVLPREIQTRGGATLPTGSRLYGVVNVSTSLESERVARGEVAQSDSLQIQISRDRLLETSAYEVLRAGTRAAIDFYADIKRKLQVEEAEAKAHQAEAAQLDPISVLSTTSGLSKRDADKVTAAILSERKTATARVAVAERQSSLIASLATVGMVSMFMEHEQSRVVQQVRIEAERLAQLGDDRLTTSVTLLRELVERLDALRPLVRVPMEPENRERARLRADRVVDHTVDALSQLLKGTEVQVDVAPIRLPEGSLAEWSALLQNVLLNAANAAIEASAPRIAIRSRSSSRSIRVLNNGRGIDLNDLKRLFEPFERGPELPAERRAMGLGGTGLGLTIVRTIGSALKVEVGFEAPPRGWSTAFVVHW